MKKIGIVTTSRADYGLYLPILKKIRSRADLKLLLYVSGTHLSPIHGCTVRRIEQDGYPIAARIPILSGDDSPPGISESMGRATAGFARAYAKNPPDIVVVLGDRFEMHSAALAAVPFKIPIAHIHGGELTYGAFDELFRHSLTKLSQLHFVATRLYAQRLIRMGEEPWRVIVSGAPGLDNVLEMRRISKKSMEKKFGIDLSRPVILVTFHPVTLEFERTGNYISSLLRALSSFRDHHLVFTVPNADTCGTLIIEKIQSYAKKHSGAFLVDSFGQEGYLSMMGYSSLMVGNSSSGIVEAASFRLPVVNIGSRQEGRLRPPNVIDTGYDIKEIKAGIRKGLSPDFRKRLGAENPYGDGKAASRIVEALARVNLAELAKKRFYEGPIPD